MFSGTFFSGPFVSHVNICTCMFVVPVRTCKRPDASHGFNEK